MYTTLVTFRQFNISPSAQKAHQSSQCEMVKSFCNTFVLPDDTCNHSRFDENLASKIASYKDRALKPVTDMLSCADNEKDITAGLFLLNRIIDAGAQSAYKTYPVISKFNYSSSSNVQTMLAGVYRKTLVPDAFGPLMTMFLKNFTCSISRGIFSFPVSMRTCFNVLKRLLSSVVENTFTSPRTP